MTELQILFTINEMKGKSITLDQALEVMGRVVFTIETLEDEGNEIDLEDEFIRDMIDIALSESVLIIISSRFLTFFKVKILYISRFLLLNFLKFLFLTLSEPFLTGTTAMIFFISANIFFLFFLEKKHQNQLPHVIFHHGNHTDLYLLIIYLQLCLVMA